MTTIYNYKLFCQTENTWVTKWDTVGPTVCPCDPSHTIIPDSVAVIKTICENYVTLKDDTPGYFQISSVVIDVPASGIGSVYTHDVSYQFDMQLSKINYIPINESVNDILSIIIGPDDSISHLSADGNIGDTTLNLDSSIFSENIIVKGCNLKITDNTTTQDLGKITAIDPINYTIIVENALTTSFNVGSEILLNLYLAENFTIPYAGLNIPISNKLFATKIIGPNTNIRFLYQNENGLAKKVVLTLEYSYS